ncbi:MAG TPA: Uma2 family endonuclease [Thermoanaerobaculia bacterium]|nr:Uma2 family endonuclease [Thermoanaerobaculia bacterium]
MAILHSSADLAPETPAPDVHVPAEAHTLDGFREWFDSPEFPETGRIDYLAGEVVVDMNAEELFTHNAVKLAVAAEFLRISTEEEWAEVFIDGARIVSEEADLSVEPDVVLVTHESFSSGRVQILPAKRSKRLMELGSAPDLVVEVISDSSVGKDRRRLPPLYARAGVRELWLIDGRWDELDFALWQRRPSKGAFPRATTDSDGWLQSLVLGRRIRLRRQMNQFLGPGSWRYKLETSP